VSFAEPTPEELDTTQYSLDSIRLYEAVFGEDFVSPGGYTMAVELINRLQLQPGCRVLDVGCGLGGSAFVMAHEFGLIVDGIDLSNNMLLVAEEKRQAHQLTDRVKFEHGDCLQLDCSNHYDAIYSRDVFLHISDKSRLFSVLYAALKPGGKLLFTDYCCGEKPWGDAFVEYVQDRGYCLHTLSEYTDLIAQQGFVEVHQADMTDRFIDILRNDINTIEALDLSEQVRSKLKKSWQGKLTRAESGDHRWGLFTALGNEYIDLVIIFMKYIFRLIRWPLGQIVILIDRLTRPREPSLSPEKRAELDATTSNMKLYQFQQCPFCIKTRRTIRRLGLNIELRDARNDPQWNRELINEGGRYQVPCLRLVKDDGSVEWMYESDNINQYLHRRFS
jgi:cyclopropane fatty-acyl-phospholipid synthase-like methyltransferase/glutaredoxin